MLHEVGPDEPEKLAERFAEDTETTIGPLYRMTPAFDRHRLAEVDGDVTGQSYHIADPDWAITKAMDAAVAHDPVILRAAAAIGSLVTTQDEVFARPGLLDRIAALGADTPRYPTPGPTRAELVPAISQQTPPQAFGIAGRKHLGLRPDDHRR